MAKITRLVCKVAVANAISCAKILTTFLRLSVQAGIQGVKMGQIGHFLNKNLPFRLVPAKGQENHGSKEKGSTPKGLPYPTLAVYTH